MYICIVGCCGRRLTKIIFYQAYLVEYVREWFNSLYAFLFTTEYKNIRRVVIIYSTETDMICSNKTLLCSNVPDTKYVFAFQVFYTLFIPFLPGMPKQYNICNIFW